MIKIKVKVAHICTSKSSYKILEYKLKRIAELGYDISIISSDDCEIDDSFFKENNIKIFFVNMNRKINLKDDFISTIKLTQLINKEKFDIVHTHTAKAGIIGRVSAKIAKVPIIIHTSHGLPYFDGMDNKKFILYKILEKFGARLSDVLCSQNKEDLIKLKELTKDKSKIYYEGNGVDLEYLDDVYSAISEDDIINIKKEFDIKNNTKIILMAARFEPIKNHKLFIKAIEILSKKNDEFICLLAGEGVLKDSILKYVNDNKLSDKIKFIGERKDIYKFIKLSDVVVLTSIKEGIPRIIMESMAFNKAVVATNVLGTRELVVNKQTGLLSELDDVDTLVDNINNIITNDDIRNLYGNNARKRIEENFTEKMVANRIDKIYKKALSSRR